MKSQYDIKNSLIDQQGTEKIQHHAGRRHAWHTPQTRWYSAQLSAESGNRFVTTRDEF